MKTKMMDSKKADAELPNRKENATERDNWERRQDGKGHTKKQFRQPPASSSEKKGWCDFEKLDTTV